MKNYLIAGRYYEYVTYG